MFSCCETLALDTVDWVKVIDARQKEESALRRVYLRSLEDADLEQWMQCRDRLAQAERVRTELYGQQTWVERMGFAPVGITTGR